MGHTRSFILFMGHKLFFKLFFIQSFRWVFILFMFYYENFIIFLNLIFSFML